VVPAHVEPGETLVETAVREVAEETGIQGRALVTLGTIDYWFSTPNYRIHKMVHHYLLEAIGGEISVEGDPDHEAIDARWFRLDTVQRQLTFPNERRIARTAWDCLAGTA
jgi:8-oxo-dGTP pyrophosphatase MutT (NUDIX family)